MDSSFLQPLLLQMPDCLTPPRVSYFVSFLQPLLLQMPDCLTPPQGVLFHARSISSRLCREVMDVTKNNNHAMIDVD